MAQKWNNNPNATAAVVAPVTPTHVAIRYLFRDGIYILLSLVILNWRYGRFPPILNPNKDAQANGHIMSFVDQPSLWFFQYRHGFVACSVSRIRVSPTAGGLHTSFLFCQGWRNKGGDFYGDGSDCPFI